MELAVEIAIIDQRKKQFPVAFQGCTVVPKLVQDENRFSEVFQR